MTSPSRSSRDAHLGALGEKRFLAELLPDLANDPRFINGFGHDAAAIRLTEETALILKTDRAAQPTAATRGWASFESWGRLAVTANCSDVLTSGGRPLAFMLAMILPASFSAREAREIVEGAAAECSRRDVVFAGGDTKEGIEPQLVGCCAGLAHPDRIWRRDLAHQGDVLVLAGSLGAYLAAYLSLQDGTASIDDRLMLCRRVLSEPTAQWDESEFINEVANISAAMDLSDGLYDAVATIAGAGALLWETSLPFHDLAIKVARERGLSTLGFAFGVGDWGILYAMRPAEWERLAPKVQALGLSLAAIGELDDSHEVKIKLVDGATRTLRPIINEHFTGHRREEARYASMFVESDLFLR